LLILPEFKIIEPENISALKTFDARAIVPFEATFGRAARATS
jgi:hypothetical protein